MESMESFPFSRENRVQIRVLNRSLLEPTWLEHTGLPNIFVSVNWAYLEIYLTMVHLNFQRNLSLLILVAASTASLEIELTRKLIKSGFHRDLESIILLPLNIKQQCKSITLMLLETLPPGIYADPFEVQAAQQFGGPKVTFDRPVDIEAAAFSSEEHKLKVFVDIDSASKVSTTKDALRVDLKLPVHARYHQPSLNPFINYASVTIFNPRLFINCSINGVTESSVIESVSGFDYKWHQINYKNTSSRVVLKVPVGQEKDKPLVVIITLIITVAVSAILCKSILEFSHFDQNKCS